MPGMVDVKGFPVPREAEPSNARRPPSVSDELERYFTTREDAIRRQSGRLADGVNHVAMAAFSPNTYIKGLAGDVTITGTTSGAATKITDLTHLIVTPVPATLWCDLTGRLEETGGTGSVVAVEVRVNTTNYWPRAVTLVAANTTEHVSCHGFYDPASADGAFWMEPQTLYTVDVYAFKVTAGATIVAEKGSGSNVDWTLRVRVEPRIL